jgi:hypothetical protein
MLHYTYIVCLVSFLIQLAIVFKSVHPMAILVFVCGAVALVMSLSTVSYCWDTSLHHDNSLLITVIWNGYFTWFFHHWRKSNETGHMHAGSRMKFLGSVNLQIDCHLAAAAELKPYERLGWLQYALIHGSVLSVFLEARQQHFLCGGKCEIHVSFIPNIENMVVVCGLKFILVERRKPCVVAGKLK